MAEFSGWDAVLSVEGNGAAGSILLRYDASRVDPAGMEARAAARLGPPAGAASPKPLLNSRPKRRASRPPAPSCGP